MLAGGDIPDLVECVDANSIRVHAPASVIFVCGGLCDASGTSPKSLRDAFMRFAFNKPFDKHKTILAEEVNAFFPNGDYKDILNLETDIAQVADLIILNSKEKSLAMKTSEDYADILRT